MENGKKPTGIEVFRKIKGQLSLLLSTMVRSFLHEMNTIGRKPAPKDATPLQVANTHLRLR
ncbi:MAG: hypothetical protein ACOYUB_04785 [Patescibacteria group bacterium]